MFSTFTIVWIVIGVSVLPVTLLVTAPFGRHASRQFGPQIANRIGWLIMESPAIWCFALVFLMSVRTGSQAAWLMGGLWMAHYVHRGIIYPFRTRTVGKTIPLVIVLSAFVFQIVNGILNGVALTDSDAYSTDWFSQPVFWAGLGLFLSGAGLNLWSDNLLLRLRHQGETGYKIPRGMPFSRISCPNFLGEMIQWTGWAVMCWNLAALSFAVWSIANLVPRAIAHHRWYNEHFDDYPAERKAVFPGIL